MSSGFSLKNGAPLRDGDRSALAVAGTRKIRWGEPVAFVKIVAVAPAVVTREGQVRRRAPVLARGARTAGGLAGREGRAGVIHASRAARSWTEIREGRAGAAAGRSVHDPGAGADDADAGSATVRRDHRAGR